MLQMNRCLCFLSFSALTGCGATVPLGETGSTGGAYANTPVTGGASAVSSSNTGGAPSGVNTSLNCPPPGAPGPRTLQTLASGQSSPYSIAIDSTSVYWSTCGSENLADGTVMKVPLDGGALVTLATGQGEPVGIAVDATSVTGRLTL